MKSWFGEYFCPSIFTHPKIGQLVISCGGGDKHSLGKDAQVWTCLFHGALTDNLANRLVEVAGGYISGKWLNFAMPLWIFSWGEDPNFETTSPKKAVVSHLRPLYGWINTRSRPSGTVDQIQSGGMPRFTAHFKVRGWWGNPKMLMASNPGWAGTEQAFRSQTRRLAGLPRAKGGLLVRLKEGRQFYEGQRDPMAGRWGDHGLTASNLAHSPSPSMNPGEASFADQVPESLRIKLREQVVTQEPDKCLQFLPPNHWGFMIHESTCAIFFAWVTITNHLLSNVNPGV